MTDTVYNHRDILSTTRLLQLSSYILEIVILTVALVLDVEVCYAVSAKSVSRTRPRTMDPTAPSCHSVRHPVESRAVSSAKTSRLTVTQSIRWSDSHSSDYQCVRNRVPRGSARSHRICKSCRHMRMYNSWNYAHYSITVI